MSDVLGGWYRRPISLNCLIGHSGRLVTVEQKQLVGLPLRLLRGVLTRAQDNMKLRTKLLLSFVLLTAGLTCATLWVLRRNAEAQAQHQIEQEARNAVLIFRAVNRQQQMALSRKADLLAWVAFMRNGDATAIEDASGDPWQSEDCNLFALADKDAKIAALHSSGPALPSAAAQEMLHLSVLRGETSGWWFVGKNLYQVVLQPFYEDPATKRTLEGYVIVGRLIDDQTAADLARMTSADIGFQYGDEIIIATLSPDKTNELNHQLHDGRTANQRDLFGEHYLVSAIELTPGVHSAGNLIVLKSYSEVAASLERLNRLLIGIGIVAILAGGTFIFVISDTVTRPLASLVQGVQALEHGDFTHPLKAGGHDEVSRLTHAFDGMRSTLQKNDGLRAQLETQLRQAQKMEALGRLAGGVAHDFNNLLTVIRGHGELMLDRMKPGDPFFNSSTQVLKTADRAVSLTRQMLAFSRMQVLQPKILDVNELIAEMSKLLRRLVREDIEFNMRLGDSLGRVKADPGQLEQVFLNLTVNASDAMPRGGKLTIETRNIVIDGNGSDGRTSLAPGNYILVSVSDTGHGMDAATKSRIFEPFFTTKEPGKGTGLGLATVYGIIQQSGGSILVESEPAQGSRFDVYLPACSERPTDTLQESPREFNSGAGHRKTILIVEDEADVRDLACEFLTSAGYSVLTARDGQEALETVDRLGKSIQVVLTDIVMPKMRGPELGSRLRAVLPHVKIIYMTGYIEQGELEAGILNDGLFLQKPFSREALISQVSRALARLQSSNLGWKPSRIANELSEPTVKR
jgi:signal transduction histidine kinase/CheY-like chemotaxis protein